MPKTNTTNKFVNDGSFMEMFKKKMAEANSGESIISDKNMTKTDITKSETKTNDDAVEIKGVKRTADPHTSQEDADVSSPRLPIVGKRRAKILKTGMVAKKVQKDPNEDDSKKDAWSKYLDEVRKYKTQKCIEDDPGTALVK